MEVYVEVVLQLDSVATREYTKEKVTAYLAMLKEVNSSFINTFSDLWLQLNFDGANEEVGDDGGTTARQYLLPCVELYELWESLHYENTIKADLLQYANTAMLFADRNGEPGTGKTSLAKSLAQKISIRLSNRLPSAQLIVINSHSVLSKFFSESAKLIQKLFEQIALVLHPETFVCVLVDEVESLVSSRSTMNAEPGDSTRAVNAVLTQLDHLARNPNVLIVATTNLTGTLDTAFVDRADLKIHVGLPTCAVRYEILRKSIQELIRTRIVQSDIGPVEPFRESTRSIDLYKCPSVKTLLSIAESCVAFSGRSIKRLTFITHLTCDQKVGIPLSVFLSHMASVIERQGVVRTDCTIFNSKTEILSNSPSKRQDSRTHRDHLA
eukprot:CFRG1784T1